MPPHSVQILPNRHGEDREAMLLDTSGREMVPSNTRACCTDCHWCVLFLLALSCLGMSAGYGAKYGNPAVFDRLVTGRDFKGRLCGIDEGVKDFKYAYFTVQLNSPPVGNTSAYWNAKTRSNLHVVCTTSCPKVNQTAATIPVPARSKQACAPDMYPDWCTWYGAETFKLVHYCIDPLVFDVSVPWEQYFEDLRAAATHLVAVLPVAIATGFVFLTVLEKCGAVCVWFLLLVVAVVPAGIGLWVYHDAGQVHSGIDGTVHSLTNLSAADQKIIAYGCWAVSGLVILLACCFAGTVRGIAAVVRCTSQFLKEVPSQMLQPIMFGVAHLVVIAGWLVIFIMVMSIGASEGEPEQCLAIGDIYCLKWDKSATQWAALFLVLMVLWILNFLHACSHFGTSYAVGAWYFTRPDPLTNVKHVVEGGLSCCDIKLTCKAVYHGLRRHAGSLAFGAFAISLAKVCKLLLRWVSKDYENSSTNGAVRVCLRCTNCLAECFERFVQFVSEHAYVEMALKGHSFCTSAKEAMALAARRPGLFALVGRVAFVVRLMGVLIITSVATYIVALTLLWWKPVGMQSMTAPLVVAAISAMTIGEVMMHPFVAAARANLHCYCLDAASHMSPEFTPQSMQRIIDDEEEHLSEGSRSCCGKCCPCF